MDFDVKPDLAFFGLLFYYALAILSKTVLPKIALFSTYWAANGINVTTSILQLVFGATALHFLQFIRPSFLTGRSKSFSEFVAPEPHFSVSLYIFLEDGTPVWVVNMPLRAKWEGRSLYDYEDTYFFIVGWPAYFWIYELYRRGIELSGNGLARLNGDLRESLQAKCPVRKGIAKRSIFTSINLEEAYEAREESYYEGSFNYGPFSGRGLSAIMDVDYAVFVALRHPILENWWDPTFDNFAKLHTRLENENWDKYVVNQLGGTFAASVLLKRAI